MAGRGAADSRHRAKRDQLPEVLATLPDDGEVQAQVDSRRDWNGAVQRSDATSADKNVTCRRGQRAQQSEPEAPHPCLAPRRWRRLVVRHPGKGGHATRAGAARRLVPSTTATTACRAPLSPRWLASAAPRIDDHVDGQAATIGEVAWASRACPRRRRASLRRDGRRARPAASPVTVCRRTRDLDAGQGVRAVATHPRHVQNGQTDQTLAHEAP